MGQCACVDREGVCLGDGDSQFWVAGFSVLRELYTKGALSLLYASVCGYLKLKDISCPELAAVEMSKSPTSEDSSPGPTTCLLQVLPSFLIVRVLCLLTLSSSLLLAISAVFWGLCLSALALSHFSLAWPS